MKYIARVEVNLKPGHSDPEGETTREALIELNYPVDSVRVGKVYEILFEASSINDAQMKGEEMCRRLLANPVKDDYKYRIEEAENE
jgi:phosphoribosylformylglycinamidine synthase PurS subunit